MQILSYRLWEVRVPLETREQNGARVWASKVTPQRLGVPVLCTDPQCVCRFTW